MRQGELFPMLLDQKQIDNYIWFQKMLAIFKNKKKKFLRSNANFKNTLNIYMDWYDDDGFEYSKLSLLRQIHQVKKSLKKNKETLQRIEDGIEQCDNVVNSYGIFIVSKKLI